MKTPPAPRTADAGFSLVAVGFLAICCGGPLLIAALAATGLGAWLYAQGVALLGVAAVLAGAGLVLAWLSRRGRIAPGSGGPQSRATGEAREQENR